MAYLEMIKEIAMGFPYWQQIALLLCGMILVFILQTVRRLLRIRRFKIGSGHRSIIVIESRNYKKRKKEDINTRYFRYIENAQYGTIKCHSAEDTPS